MPLTLPSPTRGEGLCWHNPPPPSLTLREGALIPLTHSLYGWYYIDSMATQTAQTIDTETLNRELTELDRLLHRIQGHIQLTAAISKPKTPQEIREVWKRTGGILKDKITEDPVEWQRKIRAEWD